MKRLTIIYQPHVRKSSQSRLQDRSDSESSSTDSSDIKIRNQSNTETYDGWNKSDKTPNTYIFYRPQVWM
jgi:hypothetical protein